MHEAPSNAPTRPLAWEELARRIAHFAGLFGLGLGATAVLGFATIAVLTHALTPSEYGKLAVLLFFSGLVTVVVNLGTLPGTMSWVFGGTDEDDVGLEDGERKGADDPRRAAFTGVVLTAAAAGVAVVAAYLLRGPLDDLLADGSGPESLPVLAALAAVPASLIRLLGNIMRYGRRPGAYVVAEVSRPLFVLAGACIVLATGGGVHAALVVYVVGGFAAVTVALLLARHDLRFAFSPNDARWIFVRGLPIVPAALSNWTMLNADVFFLSLFAPSAQVGVYRVATGISRIGSYVVSLFMRAWGPLTASPLAFAVEKEHGHAQTSARTLEFFVMGSAWVLLGLAAFADVLVRIAPSAYSAAAPLIPLLACVYILRGTFVLTYHGSERQDRRRWLLAMFVVCTAVFVAACILLIPPMGSTGAALAGVLAFGVGTIVMLFLAQRGPIPMALRVSRPLGALVVAGLLYGAVQAAPASGTGYLVDVAAVVAFPLLMVGLGLVPRWVIRPLVAAGAGFVPGRGRGSGGMQASLRALDPSEVDLLDHLIRRRESLAAYLDTHREEESAVRLRLVTALSRLTRLPTDVPLRPEMSRYVLEDASVAHHTTLGYMLSADEEISPYVLDALYEAAREVRSVPPRAWPSASPGYAS